MPSSSFSVQEFNCVFIHLALLSDGFQRLSGLVQSTESWVQMASTKQSKNMFCFLIFLPGWGPPTPQGKFAFSVRKVPNTLYIIASHTKSVKHLASNWHVIEACHWDMSAVFGQCSVTGIPRPSLWWKHPCQVIGRQQQPYSFDHLVSVVALQAPELCLSLFHASSS